MKITIISVGQKHLPELATLINNYIARLPKSYSVNWRLIKHASGDAKTSVARESEKILSEIPDDNKVVLLDEKGVQLDNESLSNKLFSSPHDTTFIIGGAYGVNNEVIARADLVWSLSKIVLPHQIVRLILAEQIYRSFCIHTNHPYHHS